ncbi:phage tail protein [Azospirillum griseum]|uniref:Phage tail protein n=1 Tax=Azospirillum griseum TaxID=2496639 RepID=A0A3S0HTU5_9PROT|nr:tail fiber protein [Azospirillum griseum]RTR14187.1 phage tail protein [Azospirillum griseum]
MVDSVLGEIRPFAGNYAPEGWALCDGRLLKVMDYQALFSLIGTTYGGDGTTTFAVPDLRGRLPVGQGQGAGLTNRTVGQSGGASMVQLSTANMPSHTHSFSVSGNTGTTNTPASGTALAVPAPQAGGTMVAYVSPTATPAPTLQTFDDASIASATGGNQAHYNVMPYIAINYIIAITGLYPSRPNQ